MCVILSFASLIDRFQHILLHTNPINSACFTRFLNICLVILNLDLDVFIFFLALGWIFKLYFIITYVCYIWHIVRSNGRK